MSEQPEKRSGAERQRQIEAAVTVAMQGYRHDLELQRGKTARLRELRLAQEAVIAIPAPSPKKTRQKRAPQ